MCTCYNSKLCPGCRLAKQSEQAKAYEEFRNANYNQLVNKILDLRAEVEMLKKRIQRCA